MENFERKTFEELYENYIHDRTYFTPTMDDIIKLNIVFENIDKFTVQQISDFFESNGK
jgi:hypothetical protein